MHVCFKFFNKIGLLKNINLYREKLIESGIKLTDNIQSNLKIDIFPDEFTTPNLQTNAEIKNLEEKLKKSETKLMEIMLQLKEKNEILLDAKHELSEIHEENQLDFVDVQRIAFQLTYPQVFNDIKEKLIYQKSHIKSEMKEKAKTKVLRGASHVKTTNLEL